MRGVSVVSLLIAFCVMQGCLKKKKEMQLPEESELSDVNIPSQSEDILKVSTALLEEAVAARNLLEALPAADASEKVVELNLILRDDWATTLPLKFKNGDFKKFSDEGSKGEVVGLGNVQIKKFKSNSATLKVLKKILKAESKNTLAFDVVKVEVPASNIADLIGTINALNNVPGVVFSEPNAKVKAVARPNDSRLSELWGLFAIKADEVWSSQQGTGATTVAVVDSGIDINHEDLKANLWTNSAEIPNNGLDDDFNGFVDDIHGWDFIDNDNSPNDEHGHGTHCAGVIGARGNNSIGVTGVAWNTKIMPIKVLSGNGAGDTYSVFNGLLYAIANGAKVLSNSYTSASPSVLLANAIRFANDSDRLFVASAGNDSAGKASYPAYYTNAFTNMLSVTSSQSNGSLSPFSNVGDGVDIAAPGSKILSTMNNNLYAVLSGTSMSAPFVAGTAALLWDSFPSKSMNEIRKEILNGSDYKTAYVGKVEGARHLNIANSVQQLLGTATPRPVAPLGIAMGIRFKYYEGRWNKIPDLSALSPKKTGTTSLISLKESIKNNNFALIFEGLIKIETAGEHTFYLNSDDGSALYVNDVLVTSNDGIHTPRERKGSVQLATGYQKIRIEYFQASQGKKLGIEWKGPTFKRQKINDSKKLFYFF